MQSQDSGIYYDTTMKRNSECVMFDLYTWEKREGAYCGKGEGRVKREWGFSGKIGREEGRINCDLAGENNLINLLKLVKKKKRNSDNIEW